MARVSTHVLDTSRGLPAAGVAVDLYRDGVYLASLITDTDGRVPAQETDTGIHELVFHAGEYLKAEPQFLGDIVIRFHVCDMKAKYHVPLLLSPYGYSTYRGS